jgi:predicted DNA-binding transcriptional regulator AlpA
MADKKIEGEGLIYWKAADVARALGVTRNTVWNLANRPDFPPRIRLSERCTRWPKAAVIAFIDGHASRVPDETSGAEARA